MITIAYAQRLFFVSVLYTAHYMMLCRECFILQIRSFQLHLAVYRHRTAGLLEGRSSTTDINLATQRTEQ